MSCWHNGLLPERPPHQRRRTNVLVKDDKTCHFPLRTQRFVSKDCAVIPRDENNKHDKVDALKEGLEDEDDDEEEDDDDEEARVVKEEEESMSGTSTVPWGKSHSCHSFLRKNHSILAATKVFGIYKEATSTSTTSRRTRQYLQRYLEQCSTVELQEVLWTHLHISLARTPRDWSRLVDICQELLLPVAHKVVVEEILKEKEETEKKKKKKKMSLFLSFFSTRSTRTRTRTLQAEERTRRLWRLHTRQEAARCIQRAFVQYKKTRRLEPLVVNPPPVCSNNQETLANSETKEWKRLVQDAPPPPPPPPPPRVLHKMALAAATEKRAASWQWSLESSSSCSSWTEGDESLTSFGSVHNGGPTSMSLWGQRPWERSKRSTLSSTCRRLVSHVNEESDDDDNNNDDDDDHVGEGVPPPQPEKCSCPHQNDQKPAQSTLSVPASAQLCHGKDKKVETKRPLPTTDGDPTHPAWPTSRGWKMSLLGWNRWPLKNYMGNDKGNGTNDDDDDDKSDFNDLPEANKKEEKEISSRIPHSYHWWTTLTGRYCLRGGWSEQFDFFKEGHLSEFAPLHGSAMSNYFKFLKWCGVVTLVLFLIYLPMLVVNSWGTRLYGAAHGPATPTRDHDWMMATTLGNLGESDLVFFVSAPWCDKRGASSPLRSCALDKSNVAFFYSFLDVVAVLWVTVAWIWLLELQRVERAQAQDSPLRPPITVSDYTLWIPRLQNCGAPCQTAPSLCANDLKRHFWTLLGARVVQVQFLWPEDEEWWWGRRRGGGRFDVWRNNSRRVANSGLTCWKEKEVEGGGYDDDDEEGCVRIPARPLPSQAFVTLDSTQGLFGTLREYRCHEWKPTWLYPRRLLLRGGGGGGGGAPFIRLGRLQQAPDPCDISWDNLTKRGSLCLRFWRRILAVVCAFCLLFLSVACNVGAWRRFDETLRQGGVCPPPLEGDLWREELDRDKNLTRCYCRQLSEASQWKEPLCYHHVRSAWFSSVLIVLAAMVVCLVNSPLLTWFVNKVIVEHVVKPVTVEQGEASRWLWLFGWEWINTACLVVLLPPLLEQGRGGGADTLFDVHWYQLQGRSLLWVMAFRIVSPHVMPLVQYARHVTTLQRRRRWQQGFLDASPLQPPIFHGSLRLAQALVTFHVCWMYAMGMPILVLWGTLSFVVTFWVDKFLCCHFYQLPTLQGDCEVERLVQFFMGLSIPLHLLMSIVLLGGPGRIFDGHALVLSKNGGRFTPWDEYIFVQHLVLLQVFLLTIVVGYVAIRFVIWVCGFAKKGQGKFPCRGENSKQKHENDNDNDNNNNNNTTTAAAAMEQNPWAASISFTRAQERGIFSGPTLYKAPFLADCRNSQDASSDLPLENVVVATSLLPMVSSACGVPCLDNSEANDTKESASRGAFRHERQRWDTRGVSSVTMDTV